MNDWSARLSFERGKLIFVESSLVRVTCLVMVLKESSVASMVCFPFLLCHFRREVSGVSSAEAQRTVRARAAPTDGIVMGLGLIGLVFWFVRPEIPGLSV